MNNEKNHHLVIERLTDEMLCEQNDAALYTERARAWYHLKQYDKLLKDCRAAIDIDVRYYKVYIYFGNYLLEKYDYKGAAANYSKAIQLNAGCAEAYNNRGTLYLRQANYDAAEKDYEAALNIHAGYADAYNNLGCLWYNRQEFEKAIINFNKAIDIADKDAGYYHNRALAWLYVQEYGNAIEDFNKAIALNPSFSQAYFERGNAWLKLHNQNNALNDFTKAIELDKNYKHGLAHFKRGNIWLGRKDYRKSIDDYNEAIRINVHFAEAYNNRGTAQHALGIYIGAVEDFTKAISLDGKYAMAYFNRGLVLIDKMEYDRAMIDFDRALWLDGCSADAYNRRGLLWLGKNELDKALDDFNRCITINPVLADAYNNRSRVWYAKKDNEKAFEDCNTTISLHPNFAEAFFLRAIIWVQKKEYNKAIDDFGKALQCDNGLALAYNNRGLLWYAKGEYDKALGDFSAFSNIMQGDARGYCNIGLIWHARKKYEIAVDYYTRAIHCDEAFADAYCRRGNALFSLRQYREALRDYEKAVGLDRNFKFLSYNMDVAKSKTGGHVEINDASGVTAFYFTEMHVQSLEAEQQNIVRQAASAVLEAIDSIKEYAAGGTDDVDALYYYTNLKVADILVMNKSARLPYFNAIAQLQGEENVLLNFLSDNDTTGIAAVFNNSHEYYENNIYVGCFAPAVLKTKLNGHTRLSKDGNMPGWKLHTANNSGDIAECGLLIKTGFFTQNDDYIFLDEQHLRLKNNTKISAKPKEQLYKVLYYDTQAGTVCGDMDNGVKKSLLQFKHALQQLILCGSKAGGPVNALVSKLVYRFISELRYLFKEASSAAENELRIIEYVSADDDRVKTENTEDLPRNLYIESSKSLHPHLSEIVLGPTVRNPERWTYLGVHMKRNKYVNL